MGFCKNQTCRGQNTSLWSAPWAATARMALRCGLQISHSSNFIASWLVCVFCFPPLIQTAGCQSEGRTQAGYTWPRQKCHSVGEHSFLEGCYLWPTGSLFVASVRPSRNYTGTGSRVAQVETSGPRIKRPAAAGARPRCGGPDTAQPTDIASVWPGKCPSDSLTTHWRQHHAGVMVK